MTNEIYQAFVNAGFKKDAIKLSETVRIKNRSIIRPALGHYIAILDDIKDKPYIDQRLKGLSMLSEGAIYNFIELKSGSNNPKEVEKAADLVKKLKPILNR